MSKRLVSPVYPEINNPEVGYVGKVKRLVDLPAHQPVLSEQALLCVQSFANATGISPDQVASEVMLSWWDNFGAYVVSAEERKTY